MLGDDRWDADLARARRQVRAVAVAIVAAAVVAALVIVFLGVGDGSNEAEGGTTGSSGASASEDPAAAAEEVVDAYITALREADVDAAVDVTCGELHSEAVDAQENDTGTSDDFSDLETSILKSEPDPEDSSGKTMLVFVDWKFQGDESTVVFTARLEDGAWKACSVVNEAELSSGATPSG